MSELPQDEWIETITDNPALFPRLARLVFIREVHRDRKRKEEHLISDSYWAAPFAIAVFLGILGGLRNCL